RPAMMPRARTITPAETRVEEPVEATPEVGGTPVVGSGPCRLTVTTTPAGSTIAIDGQDIGPTPITIDGPCDRKQLAITHARYQTVTRPLALVTGKPQTLDVMLQRSEERRVGKESRAM